MVKCPECGAENPDEAEFCKKCGAKLATLTPAPEEKTPAEKKPPEEDWSIKKKFGTLILFAFILMISVGGIVTYVEEISFTTIFLILFAVSISMMLLAYEGPLSSLREWNLKNLSFSLILFISLSLIIGITFTAIPDGGEGGEGPSLPSDSGGESPSLPSDSGGESPSLPSDSGGESEPSGGGGGTGTFKVAVYNDTSSYVTDVNLIIDGESVKQMTIYNGYWADWGTYSLEEGTHDIRLEVEYFDLSQNSYGTEVREGTEEAKAGVVYGAGYWITTSSILYKSYPGATMEPTPVEW